MVNSQMVKTGTANNLIKRTPNKSWVQPLPAGQAGILVTLGLMARWCLKARFSQELRDFAHYQILKTVAGHDFDREIIALFEYCRDAITYRKDPYRVERLQDALRTIKYKTADCDDKVTLLVSLLLACGYKARFAVIGRKANSWTHVYCEVFTSDGWLPLDPTNERAVPGWEQKLPYKAVYDLFPPSNALKVIRRPRPVTAQGPQPIRFSLQRPQPVSRGRRVSSQMRAARPALAQLDLAGYEYWDDETLAGFWSKLGNGLKKVGKVALAVAPVALAPFTGGGSLALAAGSIGAKVVSAASAGVGAVNNVLANRAAAAPQQPQQVVYQQALQPAPQQAPQQALAETQQPVGEQPSSSMSFDLKSPMVLIGLVAAGLLLLRR